MVSRPNDPNSRVKSALDDYDSRFKQATPYYHSTMNSRYKLKELENELSSIDPNPDERESEWKEPPGGKNTAAGPYFTDT